ncbi:BOLA class I histocompatibility antigen, alpha chain BL3-7-like isoform X2 [Brachyhypopomus gauderio]
MHYDSNSKQSVPKTEWIERNVGTDYWHRSTQVQQNTQEIFRVGVAILIRRFNNTKGVHTWQVAYGCELDDDGNKTGYIRFGYDGEDFISLDMNTLTWTAADAKAVITKHKWEGTAKAVEHKAYLENTCIEWLQKYVSYGRDTLERKVPPEVSLFQKDSSSPVVCHTTCFFPRRMDISWMKNGEDLHEDVQLGETLPNQDGTFQKRSILTVSPEELDRNEYTCVVQHSGLEKELALHVEPGGGISSVGFIGVSVLLVLIGCVGFFIWRKKKNGFKAVAVQTQCT